MESDNSTSDDGENSLESNEEYVFHIRYRYFAVFFLLGIVSFLTVAFIISKKI